nr:rootletin [Nothobranchius furzeri]
MSFQQEQRGLSPRLEAVIQKLEESLLPPDVSTGERHLTLQGDPQASGATPVPITTRIFQIITSNLAEQPSGVSSEVGGEETKAPREQPSTSLMDRDQPPVKHTGLTERLDETTMLQPAVDTDQNTLPPGSMQYRSNRRRLVIRGCKPPEGVQKNRAQEFIFQVLQYKNRCGELEEKVLEKTSACEKIRLLLQAQLDSAERQKRVEQDLHVVLQKQSTQLQEEQRRSTSLSQVNSVLREQLDQAATINTELAESLRKAHRDLDLCDTHLQREQETSASRSSREQARVIALWRQVASLRSTFALLRTFTDRTLSDMRGECVAVSRQLRVTCHNFEARGAGGGTSRGVETSALDMQLKVKLKETMGLQALWDAEKIELTSRISELSDTLKRFQSHNSEKDVSLRSMEISLDRMETRRAEDKAELEVLHAEISALQKILFLIHQLVSSEEETSETTCSSHVHGQSPLRNATVKAVQNVLSKHREQTQHLRACLEAALQKVDTFQDQLKERDAERTKAEQTIQEIQRESQEAKTALEENLKRSSRDRCTLELISNEKRGLEKLLSGLQQEVNSQRGELEALQSSLSDLQRERDLLRQQREDLEMQLAQQGTEAQRREKSAQQLEEKHSSLRKELITVKESLSQINLEKEMLEEDKAALSLALTKMEAHRASQEHALTKLKRQQAALKESFTKMADLSEGLAKDKVELNRVVLQVESEKTELDKRRREAEVERTAAREVAARTQREMMNFFAEKQALESSHIQLQDVCQGLEAELSLLRKVKAEALEENSQVKRQMQTLEEELRVCRKELEASTAAAKRATCDRDQLAKDKAALDVRLNSVDRKASGLVQELLALRTEKESLETALFESQELSESLRAECTRLEGERSSLIQANESLTQDAAQVRADAEQHLKQAAEQRREVEEELAEAERKALLMLNNMKQTHRDELEAERQRKDQQYAGLLFQREQAEEQLRRRCEELRAHNQKELQQAQEEQARLQKEFNQSLLHAESEKQQVLSQKETEKAALSEEIASLQQDLATAGMEMERVQREAFSKQEQDKNTIAVMKSELQDLQNRFEESLNSHQSAELSLLEQVREMNQQKQQAEQQLEGVRQRLLETEDNLAKKQRELIEAHRELQGCAQEQDKLRRETLDLKRLLGDETRQNEAIQVSNQELRSSIKRAESDNSNARRTLAEKEQKLSVLEECRSSLHLELSVLRGRTREQEKLHLEARRELQELRRQIKVLEGENSRQRQEVLELQARVGQEEQKEEEARHEAYALKHRLLECEAGKEAALNEVAGLQCRVRKLETAEQESRELLQEREVCQQKCDQKHRETTAQLEAELEDSRTTVKELTVKVGLAETRAHRLKEELCLSGAKCRDLEHHLAALYAGLRSTVGTDHPRFSDKPGSRRRPLSPCRGRVFVKGSESSPLGSVHLGGEMNVEFLHNALLEFQEELRETQRQRDEAKAQIVKLSQDVTELTGTLEKNTIKLQELQKSLKQSEEGKQHLAEELQKANASLSLQQHEANCADWEKRRLEAEVAQLMISVQTAQTESRTLQDKLDVLRGAECFAEAEKRRFKESLDAAESRVSHLELSQCTCEGELQRAGLRAAELDAEVGALQQRLADLRRKLGESEDRCAALQVSKKKMSVSLARAEQHESQLREQVHKLSDILSDNRANNESLQEQITQLQRVLTTSEQDRRLLQEHLDQTRDALSETKRLNHALTQQSQNFQRAQEDSDLKISELEKHSRTLKESLKQQQEAELNVSQQLQREKEEIQEKFKSLQSFLQTLRGEKADTEKILMRLRKDRSALRKRLEKVEMDRLRQEEKVASVTRGNAQLEEAVCNLQQELTGKQETLETLQAQISQLEHSHAQHLLEVTARHRQELDSETHRLRDSRLQAEQALETRERAHRQRVQCLEEQVLTLKEQLDQEARRRQAYFNQMLQPGV